MLIDKIVKDVAHKGATNFIVLVPHSASLTTRVSTTNEKAIEAKPLSALLLQVVLEVNITKRQVEIKDIFFDPICILIWMAMDTMVFFLCSDKPKMWQQLKQITWILYVNLNFYPIPRTLLFKLIGTKVPLETTRIIFQHFVKKDTNIKKVLMA